MTPKTSVYHRRSSNRVARKPSLAFVCAGLVFLFWVMAAMMAPSLVPHDPFNVQLEYMLQPPGREFFFGTDDMGRDVFSRVLTGSRDILTVSFFAAIGGTFTGAVLGLAMGYFQGIFDEAFSRLGEAVISLPGIILALLLIAALGRSNIVLIGVIAFEFMWVVARTVRGAVLQEAQKDYILAARVRGDNPFYVMLCELLPNIFPIVIVEFTVRMTFAVFSVANLSFLGFGVQPPAPDWGLLVAESYGLLVSGYWWIAFFPTLAIATLVISISVIASETNRWLTGK